MKNQIFNTVKLNKMNELSGVESKLRLAVEAAEKITNNANTALELLAKCNKKLSSDGDYRACRPKIIEYEESMHSMLLDVLNDIRFIYINYYGSHTTRNVQDFIQHFECEAIYVKLSAYSTSTPIVLPNIMNKSCDELFTIATDTSHLYTINNDNNPYYNTEIYLYCGDDTEGDPMYDIVRDPETISSIVSDANGDKFVNPKTFKDIDFTDHLIDDIETIGDLAYWIVWDHEGIKEMIEDDDDVKVFKAICGALDIICRTHFFTDNMFGK